MTRLFHDLQQNTQNSSTNDFINDASRRGFKMTVPDFIRFWKMVRGRHMGAVVQELRQSGAMDDRMFEDLKNRAQGFMQMIKMIIGGN